MWFDTWTSVFRTAVAAVVAYAGIVVFLRVSGKRTLSKMNAFDLVVTVALGSTLSSIITSKDVPLLDGLLAIALLIALQLVVAWLSVRWRAFEGVVKSDPTLLLHRGKLRARAMTEQRVSPEEIEAAVRSAGLSRLEDAGAVVLETDGSFSVVSMDALHSGAGTPSVIDPTREAHGERER